MIAVDTNILIYACDSSEPRRQQIAFDLLAAASDGLLLWQVACEFIAAARKLKPHGFKPADAWARLAEFQDALILVAPSPAVLGYAKPLHLDHGISFWDAMIIAACLDAGVEMLYSEDSFGVASVGAVRFVNPFG